MGFMSGCRKPGSKCNHRYKCDRCQRQMNDMERKARNGDTTGTMNSSVFRSKPQRDDESVTNDYFNSGKQDGPAHGHAKYRTNPDGTTDYFYVRDVEGNEYDT